MSTNLCLMPTGLSEGLPSVVVCPGLCPHARPTRRCPRDRVDDGDDGRKWRAPPTPGTSNMYVYRKVVGQEEGP